MPPRPSSSACQLRVACSSIPPATLYAVQTTAARDRPLPPPDKHINMLHTLRAMALMLSRPTLSATTSQPNLGLVQTACRPQPTTAQLRHLPPTP